MKTHLVAIFLIGLILTCIQVSISFAQNQFAKPVALPVTVQPVFYQITTQDCLDYILSAGAPINSKRDTFVYKFTPDGHHVYQQKRVQMIIPVTFTNMSGDTLEYVGMSCSYWDMYLTNNSTVDIEPSSDNYCYKNGPTVFKIAPKTSTIINMPIGYPEDLSKNTKFRIGMIFQKYTGKLFEIPMSRESNTIWSNEISIN